MTQIPLNEASATQLAEFASVNLGLEVTFRNGKDNILAKMQAAGYDQDTIELPDAPAEQPKPVGRPVKQRDPSYSKIVRVILYASDEKDGERPQFVAVNGVGLLIPRGKEVDIPYPYYEALNNAKRRIYNTDENGEIVGHREVPMHQFQVIPVAHNAA